MRRLGFILSLVILVALFVSIATLTAGAQTTDSTSRPSVSQGTVTGADPSEAERRAAKSDMVEEETLPDYSQVVDSTHPGASKRRGGSGVGVTFGPMEANTSRRAPPPAKRASS